MYTHTHVFHVLDIYQYIPDVYLYMHACMCILGCVLVCECVQCIAVYFSVLLRFVAWVCYCVVSVCMCGCCVRELTAASAAGIELNNTIQSVS